MARKTSEVIDVAEMLVRWRAGGSLSEMSRSLRRTRTFKPV